MSELEWLDIFIDNLKDMMKDVGMSQRELANITGLSDATVSNYIHKRQLPGVKAIVNIAYAFDCDIGDLVDFGEPIN